MSDIPASLTTSPESCGDWLADLEGRIHNAQAMALSWSKNHSD
ncbi:hypothetical protein ACTMP5_30740 [Pseudomonas aeruginosa]|jgi:hypothetical protein|nr:MULTISPECIES: hypothetical protein [Pseudomonas]SFA66986.1 hypothetical protein SAMN05216263_12433 [Pseudomonas otitidis]MCS7559866.1 hypothetical protein [Pseudomonas aeruginosa]MCS7585831.1 hypothetical protein [Pseudomonas aeruginosa]MCS7597515.1 hypothetical protein [Pseudomonas aeruginosa]MCS7604312.1 hypothetical protein [Pseudomonas aeruginosa]